MVNILCCSQQVPYDSALQTDNSNKKQVVWNGGMVEEDNTPPVSNSAVQYSITPVWVLARSVVRLVGSRMPHGAFGLKCYRHGPAGRFAARACHAPAPVADARSFFGVACLRSTGRDRWDGRKTEDGGQRTDWARTVAWDRLTAGTGAGRKGSQPKSYPLSQISPMTRNMLVALKKSGGRQIDRRPPDFFSATDIETNR